MPFLFKVNNVPPGPPAPTATSGTNIEVDSFSANWEASMGATGYKLDVATDIDFNSFVVGYNDLDVSNVVTYSVDSNIDPNTDYYYRVRAYDNNGTSSNSNTISLTTSAGPIELVLGYNAMAVVDHPPWTQVLWTDPGNAVDNTNWTYAYNAAPQWPDQYSKVLKGTAHGNIVNSGIISKVEMGFKGGISFGSATGTSTYFPIFNGSTYGAGSYTEPFAPYTTVWKDITSDANGPGAGNWTWGDIDNLDVGVGLKASVYSSNSIIMDQLYLRITYTAV